MNFYLSCYQSVTLKDINFLSVFWRKVASFTYSFFSTIDPKTIMIKPLQASRMTPTNKSTEKYLPGSGMANFTFSADFNYLLSEPYINAGSVI